MNVGLPGAGIGGIFYLLCALAMPFKEVFLTITKPDHKFRYRLVATQLSIAVGIIVGVIAIYKLVSNVFEFDPSFSVAFSVRLGLSLSTGTTFRDWPTVSNQSPSGATTERMS